MTQLLKLIQKLWGKRVCRMPVAAALGVIAGVSVGRAFVGSVYVVEGASMEPAYPAGTHLYGAPISAPPQRGDVVLVDDGKADFAVKRVVGLPGERVQIWRGQVFINREMLVEPYLSEHTYTCPAEQGRRGATFMLCADQYFVMGDNRICSADSRDYGPLARKQIKRRVPLPEDFVRAHLAPYTLPAYGKTIIRPKTPQLAAALPTPK